MLDNLNIMASIFGAFLHENTGGAGTHRFDRYHNGIDLHCTSIGSDISKGVQHMSELICWQILRIELPGIYGPAKDQ
jgi:hypothetical protein